MLTVGKGASVDKEAQFVGERIFVYFERIQVSERRYEKGDAIGKNNI